MMKNMRKLLFLQKLVGLLDCTHSTVYPSQASLILSHKIIQLNPTITRDRKFLSTLDRFPLLPTQKSKEIDMKGPSSLIRYRRISVTCYLYLVTFGRIIIQRWDVVVLGLQKIICTGSTTPNRTKENDVSQLLEMIE